MITATGLVTAILAAAPPSFPSPYDAHGWGLRVDSQNSAGPYLVGETYDRAQVRITLVNKTAEPRPYPPLALALKANELTIPLRYSDGSGIRAIRDPGTPTRAADWQQLAAGNSVSIKLSLKDFGYEQFYKAGNYRAQVVFKSPQGSVSSVPWKIEVIEPTPDAILASHTVPLDEFEAKRRPEEQYRAVVQQIRLGNRVYLFYREFLGAKYGGQASNTFRLANLPEKVELKVTGEYGKGKRVTIRYEDATSQTGATSLVIDTTGSGF